MIVLCATYLKGLVLRHLVLFVVIVDVRYEDLYYCSQCLRPRTFSMMNITSTLH